MTITIPDWLLNGPFWLGFGTGVLLCILILLWIGKYLP